MLSRRGLTAHPPPRLRHRALLRLLAALRRHEPSRAHRLARSGFVDAERGWQVLHRKMAMHFRTVRNAFRHLDRSKSGAFSLGEFRIALRDLFNLELGEEEWGRFCGMHGLVDWSRRPPLITYKNFSQCFSEDIQGANAGEGLSKWLQEHSVKLALRRPACPTLTWSWS